MEERSLTNKEKWLLSLKLNLIIYAFLFLIFIGYLTFTSGIITDGGWYLILFFIPATIYLFFSVITTRIAFSQKKYKYFIFMVPPLTIFLLSSISLILHVLGAESQYGLFLLLGIYYLVFFFSVLIINIILYFYLKRDDLV
ncbi:hypothetical protein HYW21_06360 [Candidatus Woesearchaeota archaeon]|nr:hypothetical protein [Candidatus Woesearchaeota archaeon]